MIIATSQRSRRVLVRLERGSELLRSLVEACGAAGVRSGQLQGGGWLEEVELLHYDAQTQRLRPARRLGGPLQLLLLQGSVAERDGALAVAARALLSRELDSGLQVLGGLLHSARVLQAELVVETYDDLILRRGLDPRTGLETWIDLVENPPSAPAPVSAAPAPGTAPAAAASAAWDAVLAASAAQQREEDELSQPPRRGDLLEHPTFGRCTIERFEEDRDRLWVRVRGRLVELSLERLALEAADREGQVRLFRASKRRDNHR